MPPKKAAKGTQVRKGLTPATKRSPHVLLQGGADTKTSPDVLELAVDTRPQQTLMPSIGNAANKSRTPLPLSAGSKSKASSKLAAGTKVKASTPTRLSKLPDSKTQPKKQEWKSNKKVLPAIKKFAAFGDMLKGHLKNLPPKPTSEVRIFLSSTFSDFREERNTLAECAYPNLQEFCRQKGLDFKVVDLRWGVTDDAMNEHSTEELCLKEIAKCQQVSLGPNFVVMLGDRYGYRPLPTELGVAEFEILCGEAETLKVTHGDLLQQWYRRDDNAVPPVYVLQPIRSKLSHFGDNTPGNEELRKTHTATWWEVFGQLQNVIRRAAESAVIKGKMTEERKHDYFKSVTEFEIADGLLSVGNAQGCALGFFRELAGLDNCVLSQNKATRFIDTTYQQDQPLVDEEVKSLRQAQHAQVSKALGQTNCSKYTIAWKEGGICPGESNEHKQYLDILSGHFVDGLKHLIETGLKVQAQGEENIQASEFYTGYTELLQHLHFCNLKCETFRGRDSALEKARAYLGDNNARKPLIIYAESGVGKTSVMAMIASLVPQWLGNGSIRVIRFLGTTPDTLNIYNVLVDVAGQIADCCSVLLEKVGYRNMKTLIRYLPRFLRQMSRKVSSRIVILLDSVDQLSKVNGAYSMNWVPLDLPANVRLIISTLPQVNGCLDNIKRLQPDGDYYFHLEALPEATGNDIMETYLASKKRTVTAEQQNVLMEAFSKLRNPLFLKLCLDKALTWRSYTAIDEISLAPTIREAINALFAGLETKFGKVLIEHALGYITVGLGGLNEAELEDVLSCNNWVLDEVYKYHDPPVTGIVRLPPVLWARVFHEIEDYLVERQSAGKKTLFWYHRQFIEAARDQYATGKNKKTLHRDLADLYLAGGAVYKDITLSKRNLTVPHANRQVVPQPLVTSNKRKLQCVPYHLSACEDPNYLKEKCLCDLKFLMVRLEAFSAEFLVNDIEMAAEENQDEEIKQLKIFYEQAKGLLKSARHLPVQLLARLSANQSTPSINSLLKQARQCISSSRNPTLIPLYPFLGNPGPLILTDERCHDVICASKAGGQLIVRVNINEGESSAAAVQYGVFSIASRSLIYLEAHCIPSVPPVVPHDGKFAATVSADFKCNLVELKSGSIAIVMDLKQGKGSSKTTEIQNMCVSPDGTYLGIYLQPSSLQLWSVATTKLVKILPTDGYSDIRNVMFNGDTSLMIVTGSNTKEGASHQGAVLAFAVNLRDATAVIGTQQPILSGFCEESCGSLVGLCQEGPIYELVIVDLKEKMVHTSITLSTAVPSILLMGDPQCIIATTNKELHSVDFTQGQLLQTQTLAGDWTCLAVTQDGEYIIAGDQHGIVHIFQVDQLKIVGQYQCHKTAVGKMVFTSEDQNLVTTSFMEIKLWDWKELLTNCMSISGQEIGNGDVNIVNELLEKDQSLTHVDFTADNNFLLSRTKDGTIKVWDSKTRSLQRKFAEGRAGDKWFWAGEGSVLITLDSKSKCISFWDIKSGSEVKFNEEIHGDAEACTVNKSGNKIYIVTSQQENLMVNVLDLKEKQLIKTIQIKDKIVTDHIDILLTENEQHLAFRFLLTIQEIENIEKAEKQGQLFQANGNYKYGAVSTSSPGGAVVNLNMCYRQLTKIICRGTEWEMSRDSCVIIGRDRIVVIWDIETGKCDQKISPGTKIGMMYRPHYIEDLVKGPKICYGRIICMLKSEKGDIIAIGSEDGYLMIYDEETGLSLTGDIDELHGHSCPVHQVAISPNSQWVVSVSAEQELKMWKVEDKCPEVFCVSFQDNIQQIAFSPDSRQLAVVATGCVYLFDVHPGFT